eukprot:gene5499-5734_t
MGILVAYCGGIPYEQGFVGFSMLGNVWVAWWRVMCLAGLLPAVLQVLLLSGCPESPVWLEQVGRRDAADEACIQLWGAHALLADPEYEADAARVADLVTSASEQLMVPASGGPYFTGPGATAPLLAHTAKAGLGSSKLGGSSASGGRSRSAGLTGSHGGSSAYAAGRLGGSPNRSSNSRWPEPSRVVDGGLQGRHVSAGLSGGSFGLGGGSSSEAVGSGTAAASGRAVLEGWDSLLQRRYRWMMALALGLPIMQQASGINTVVYYSSKVFANAGLPSPILASIITGGVNLAFTVAAASVLDRHGRKPLLLVSYIGMAIMLAAVTGLTLLPVPAGVSGLVMVSLVLLYVAFFAVGSGPVTWVLLAEVLPPRIKGPAASLATAVAWAGNLLVTLSFDSLLAHAGLGGAYLMYALFNVFSAIFTAEVVVETRCRSLPEIEELLLMPDMDPRLTALLPALQAANGSGHSSTGHTEGGSPPHLTAGRSSARQARLLPPGATPFAAASQGAASDSAWCGRLESALLSGPEQDLLLSPSGAGGAGAVGAGRLALATKQEFVQDWAAGAAAEAAAAAADPHQSPYRPISPNECLGEEVHTELQEDLCSDLPESAATSSHLAASHEGSFAAPFFPGGRATAGVEKGGGTSVDDSAVIPGAAAAAAAGAAKKKHPSSAAAAAAAAPGFVVVHGFAEPSSKLTPPSASSADE